MAITRKTYDNNPKRTGMARMVDGIQYSAIGGEKTTLTLLRPLGRGGTLSAGRVRAGQWMDDPEPRL